MQFALLPLLILLSFCKGVVNTHNSGIKEKGSPNISYLTSDSLKFWDAKIGYGFVINIKDSSIIEYAYDDLGRRILASYGDVAHVEIKWKKNKDTLCFFVGKSKLYRKDLILFLSKDSLKLINEFPYNSKKELLYFKSPNQSTLPIEGNILISDTSKWIIKPKYIKKQ